jgi:hypothetical protein
MIMRHLSGEDLLSFDPKTLFDQLIHLEWCGETGYVPAEAETVRFAPFIHQLRVCHLNRASENTLERLCKFALHLKKLSKLEIEQTHLNEELALKWIEVAPQISALTLGICRFSNHSPSILLTALKSLIDFELLQCTLDDSPRTVEEIVHALSLAPPLQKIRLCNNFIQDEDLEQLLAAVSAHPLVSLELVHQTLLTPSLVDRLHGLRSLKSLTLTCCFLANQPPQLSESTVKSIVALIRLNPNLESLELDHGIKNSELDQLLFERKIRRIPSD